MIEIIFMVSPDGFICITFLKSSMNPTQFFYQTIVIYGKPCIIPYLFTRIPQGSITQAALMALMKLHGWCYASEKEVTLRAISV